MAKMRYSLLFGFSEYYTAFLPLDGADDIGINQLDKLQPNLLGVHECV